MEKTREGEIRRETKETDVFVKIDLDGSGKCSACLLYTSPSPRDRG